jgi:peroxiredoxin Q/BCP
VLGCYNKLLNKTSKGEYTMPATEKTITENQLSIGDKAPMFNIPTNGDGKADLSKLSGKNVVLYFYPRDDTPGCTTESKDFNDNLKEFESVNTIIIGVSKDSIKSHNKFQEKYELSFSLASDENSNTCEDYGVWKEKSNYGKKYMGIERSTFLIDKNGIIRQIWRKVKVGGHVDAVLEAAKEL